MNAKVCWRLAWVLCLSSQLSCSTLFDQPNGNPAAAQASDAAMLSLTVLHINDTHSHFDANPAKVQVPGIEPPIYTYVGGHARVATLASQWRQQAEQQGQPLLFLHGGDAFKGSGYFEEFGETINSDMLNRLQLDAMALGNHEFDLGIAKLANFARANNFPLVAANVDTQGEPALAGELLKPYVLFEADVSNRMQPVTMQTMQRPERVVAVFGLALQDMKNLSTQTGALNFRDEIASARQLVAYFKQHGIERVIALTHLGHQRDLTIAAAVDGIDVIVGGHSHSLLGDFSAWGLGRQSDYAAQISGPARQSPACVVQAGQYAQALGKLALTFDPQGQVVSCVGENTLLASAEFFRTEARDATSRWSDPAIPKAVAALPRTAIVAEDATMRQRLDELYLPAVVRRYGPEIAFATRNFQHVRQPGEQGSSQHGSELAPLVAASLLDYLNRPDVLASTQRPVDMALIAAGGIRSSLAAGPVREGHVLLEILPYQAAVSVLTVTGAQLKALLHDTIAATIPPGAHSGKFPYGAGIRYQAVVNTQGELTLTAVEWLQQQQWQTVQDQALYRLATTQYLANGNDGWRVLAEAQSKGTDRVDLAFVDQRLRTFAVDKIQLSTNRSGQPSYQPVYRGNSSLDCQTPAAMVQCNVQNQALLEYIKQQPQVVQQASSPTVSFIRQSN